MSGDIVTLREPRYMTWRCRVTSCHVTAWRRVSSQPHDLMRSHRSFTSHNTPVPAFFAVIKLASFPFFSLSHSFFQNYTLQVYSNTVNFRKRALMTFTMSASKFEIEGSFNIIPSTFSAITAKSFTQTGYHQVRTARPELSSCNGNAFDQILGIK